MNSPTDDDPDLSLEQLLHREELALVEARAKVAWSEYELARLRKAYPETAVLRPPVSEYTLADLRMNELQEVLGRINAALGLTGEEQDYWLKLWDYALAHRMVAEDEFDGMTREKLAAIIEAALPGVDAAVQPAKSGNEPPTSEDTTGNNSALQTSTGRKQPRNRWARSRTQHSGNLYASVRQMKSQGLSQFKMCERLDAEKMKPPELVKWRDLTWRKAYRSPEYGGTVRKWLSKVTRVTP